MFSPKKLISRNSVSVFVVLSLLGSMFGLMPINVKAAFNASFDNTIQIIDDSSSPNDPLDLQGNDTSSNNGLVQTNRSVTYRVNYSLNDSVTQIKTKHTGIRVDVGPLPIGFTAEMDNTDGNCTTTGDGKTTQYKISCPLPEFFTGDSWINTIKVNVLSAAKHNDIIAISPRIYNLPETVNPSTVTSDNTRVVKGTISYRAIVSPVNSYAKDSREILTESIIPSIRNGVEGFSFFHRVDLDNTPGREYPVLPFVFLQ